MLMVQSSLKKYMLIQQELDLTMTKSLQSGYKQVEKHNET